MAGGELSLSAITVTTPEKQPQRIQGEGNYYRNDEAMSAARTATSATSAWDLVRAEVKDTGASQRDLRACDILGKATGMSGYKTVLGSPFEKAFLHANTDDFTRTGEVERDGKKYPVYTFDAKKSDGKITLPSTEKFAGGSNEEYFAIGGQGFMKNGNYMPTAQDSDEIFSIDPYGGSESLDCLAKHGKLGYPEEK